MLVRSFASSLDSSRGFERRGKNRSPKGSTFYQVPPSELEDLLLSHPLIRDVAVVGARDDAVGERICAFVVTDGGGALTEADVRKFVEGARFR